MTNKELKEVTEEIRGATGEQLSYLLHKIADRAYALSRPGSDIAERVSALVRDAAAHAEYL